MMDWLVTEPKRAQVAATLVVLLVIGLGVWLGRKRLIVTIPVAIIVLLLAAIIIPSAVPARTVANRNNCINNLRQMRDAKEIWARTNNKLPTDVPAWNDLMGTNQFLRARPNCPSGGDYALGSVDQPPTCSFAERGHQLE